jgi:hypothetical protein
VDNIIRSGLVGMGRTSDNSNGYDIKSDRQRTMNLNR